MWRMLACSLLLTTAASAWAGANDVLVNDVWLRESVPGQTSASLQLTLTSIKPARLVEVSTPLSAGVKIQRLFPERGKIKAREVDSLSLPARYTVVFGEKNFALMLVGLKKQLNVGERVPVTLTVRLTNSRMIKVNAEAEVRPLDLSYKHYQGKEIQDHR